MTLSELQEKYPDKEFGRISIKREYEYIDEHGFDAHVTDLGWELYLNHSCDEWIIGNSLEAAQFHKDLGEAIEFVKNNP